MVRSKNKLDKTKPKWSGNYKRCVKINPVTQHYKTYEGCEFNNLTIILGDFVLVSNADADEPDTLEGCDVARIEHLFESTTTKGDKYRANVQWYSKPSKVPESIDRDLMDDRYEVVEDCRKFDSNVSIETIYKKCTVINAYEDEIPGKVYRKHKYGSNIVFVCRYRLIQKKSTFYIEPVLKLDGLSVNSDESNSCSGSLWEKKFSYKYTPNSVVIEEQANVSKMKGGLEKTRVSRQRSNPPTPKSKVSNSENELPKKMYSKLRSALRKCSIDSDSENSRTSSPAKNAVSFMENSDLENSPKSTPRKNPRRSSKSETPLKSNHFNTLGSESNYSNGKKDRNQSISENKKPNSFNNTSEVLMNTPTKTKVQNSVRKRKASRSSSEESIEPRSPSMSPRINCAGPPSVFKLYETKGQTFVIKKPIDIERKVQKNLNESNISSLLSSDDSDSELIFEKLKESGAKIVARSKSDNTGFELLTTPIKNGGMSPKIAGNSEAHTPKSARRNLSETLDNEDSRKNLLLKQLADKREDASLRIKLRRSSEQSTYKIDSDSDGNTNTKSRRRTALGTPKSILKAKEKGPGTPSVKFSNRDEINEYSPTSELSQKLLKVEIKLKRIEPELVRKSPRDRKANTRYSDYYEIVGSPIIENAETPNKRTRRTINYNERDDLDRSLEKSPIKTRSRTNSVKKSVGVSNKQLKTPSKDPETNETESAKMTKKKSEDVEQLKTPRSSKRSIKTDENFSPRKGSKMDYEGVEPTTPKKGTITPKLQTPSRSVKSGLLTPSMRKRNIRIAEPSTPLQEARARLHVSAVPKSLPCREEEFNNIYTFLEGKLRDNTGGCLYISGVPGTGKTATVNEVIRCLKKSVSKGKVDNFDFIEINAMKLTEPRQAYVMILKQLTGKKATWEQAHQLLDKRFTTAAPRRIMTLLLVDELDILCNKRQDVVYNLLDWPAKSSAQLVVITIANTMDLPERVLMGRVTSRLGLTRLTFQPYTHKQLQEIVTARLNDSHAFKSEAIQLVARKVAAVSGDARRALDICRRATEVAEVNKSEIVSMQDVNEALTEMIASVKVQAIKHCSEMEQMFLQAVCAEVARTGVEEVVFNNIYSQLKSLCSLEGIEEPSVMEALTIGAKLGAHRLLICEHSRADIHQRVLLNVSSDDVHFAMQNIEV